MFEFMSCLTEASRVLFAQFFFGTIFLFQCNNYVSQKTLKHCLVLGGGVKKWLSRPSAGYRGYYTVARRYEFYFLVAKQYFTNERSE